jgi:PAS domain S-box-containing protein
MKLLYHLLMIVLIPLICFVGLIYMQFDRMFDQMETQAKQQLERHIKDIKHHFSEAKSLCRATTEIISKNRAIQSALLHSNTRQLCKETKAFMSFGVTDIIFFDEAFEVLCKTNYINGISLTEKSIPMIQKSAMTPKSTLLNIDNKFYIISVRAVSAGHHMERYVATTISVVPKLYDEITSHLQIRLKIEHENVSISPYLDNISFDSWDIETFSLKIDDISLKMTLYENNIISRVLIQSRQTHLYVSLMIMIIFIVGITLFIRKLIAPMNQLVNAMNQYSKGELKLSHLPNVKNEIGNLSHAFHRMIIDLEHAEQRFSRIFEHAIEGIFQTHPDGYFIQVNPALAQIMGYSSPDDLMESISDLSTQMYVYPDDRERFKTILFEQNYVNSFEVQVYRKDQSIIWVSINARIVRNRNGETTFYEGFLVDITGRKSREQYNRERKALEIANRTKSEFLANISHEIRTPLNAILGLGKLLSKTTLDDSQKDYLDDMLSSSRTLLELITDILDYSKVDIGDIRLVHSPFYLMDIYQHIIPIFKQKIISKKMSMIFQITEECGIEFIGDPIRMKQILINLLGNAVKFTDKGQIWIQTDSLHKKSGVIYVTISVTDTGIGINETDQNRIFQVFTQADSSSTRRYNGTGLGLAICEKLVLKMNGKLYVTSIPSKGSTFAITIPLTFNENDLKNKPIKIPEIYHRILVIEDDEVNAKFVKSVFKDQNMDIQIIADGQNIFQLLNQYSYDMIFMDIQLPGIDGYDLTQHIRESGWITIPIIALTACAMKGDREKCLAAGMNDYLPKPFDPENVLAMYHKWKRAVQDYINHRNNNNG